MLVSVCMLRSAGVVMWSLDGAAREGMRITGWRRNRRRNRRKGEDSAMHDLLVWHYPAIPHREERKMER